MTIFDTFNIKHLSISQIKSFERNPVYWYFSYILKLPQKESEALRYGKTIHSYIESLLSKKSIDNVDPEIILLAVHAYEAAISELPEQWQELEHGIEEMFIFQTRPEYPPIKGIIDLWIKDGDTLKIIDHKTFKDKRYALKSYDLYYDLQLALYACYLCHTKQTESCELWHNQINKKTHAVEMLGVTSHQACCQILLKTIEHKIEEIEFYLTDIQHLRQEYIPRQVIYNKCKTCQYAFGGCPYKEICQNKITIEQYKERLKETMECNNEKIVALAPIMKKAKDFHNENQNLNKFDRREKIANSVITGLEKYEVTAVTIPQFLTVAGDPDYTPLLTALKEKNIKIYVEIL